MGPTGAPTDIPSGETVLVVAGRWGAAVMHDIGSALRAAGNRVLYLAAFGSPRDVDHQGSWRPVPTRSSGAPPVRR